MPLNGAVVWSAGGKLRFWVFSDWPRLLGACFVLQKMGLCGHVVGVRLPWPLGPARRGFADRVAAEHLGALGGAEPAGGHRGGVTGSSCPPSLRRLPALWC